MNVSGTNPSFQLSTAPHNILFNKGTYTMRRNEIMLQRGCSNVVMTDRRSAAPMHEALTLTEKRFRVFFFP
jgi:hypothetical protein